MRADLVAASPSRRGECDELMALTPVGGYIKTVWICDGIVTGKWH